MDRLSDSRSAGSSRSKKNKRLPLPSQRTETDSGDLLSIISGGDSTASKKSARLPLPSGGGGEVDLLSHFSSEPSGLLGTTASTSGRSQTSRSSRRKNLPLPSQGGDSLDLLGSLTGGASLDYVDDRKSQKSNSKKSSSSRKKLPLPSQLDSSDLLSNFLVPQDEPSSFMSRQKGAHSLAPKFGGSNRTLNDEGGEQELLERLSNISSQSSKSKRTLPKPSDAGRGGDQTDLLSLIQNDTETRSSNGYQESNGNHDSENQSENIVYDPVDSEDIDEEYLTSPRDNIKEAIDVLSLLSGQEGAIKPRVLTHRGKYSDEGSSEVQSEASHERAESKVSGHGYMSDRSASTGISETRKKDKVGSLDSLAQSVQDGKSWNQNRAYFLRTAKMREKKANSPLAKWLPGGSMSSTNQNPEPIISDAQIAENEMIEQLQLELEEARRTIRKHETKILSLQEGWRSFWSDYDSFRSHLDEVDAARESCMEEECERVEAEIAKERVHNENRMLKAVLSRHNSMQLMEIEATQLNKSQSSGQFDARPRSVEVTQEYRANIEIQTDESFLRNCKSAADIGSFVPRKIREKTLRPVDSKEAIEELINDEEQMAHLDESEGILLPLPKGSSETQIAIPFRQHNRDYKVDFIYRWCQALMHDDFSCSLYKT